MTPPFLKAFSVLKIDKVEITKGVEHLDLFDDVADVEAAEAQLEAFLERRAKQAAEQERVEEAWKESERRHRERRREQNREAWRCFYLDQAERLERTAAELVAEHWARAEELAGEGAA